MVQYIFGPSWFYGLDSAFEFVAMFITLFIAIYSLRIFLYAKERKYLYFMLAFLSIAVSYFIRGVVDWLAYTHFLGKIPNVIGAVSNFAQIDTLHTVGFFIHIFLMLAGFMILVAVFMGMTDFPTVTLLFISVVVLTALAQSKFIAFHLTLVAMLLFIVVHLFRNYAKNRAKTAFLVLFAMCCLLLSQAFFVLVLIGDIYYVLGHVLQLIGFLLLLASMVFVLRVS